MIENSSSFSRKTPSAKPLEILPGRVLLHVCCAPCSCAIIETLLKENFLPALFFYNPNIAPREEYILRKTSVQNFALKKKIPFFDADYDHNSWQDCVQGLGSEPERGRRCSLCFDMRLSRTARHAFENKFPVFATTNGIGRWKDMDQVNQSGLKAALHYPGLTFWPRNWRLNKALEQAQKISEQERFYKQLYCGCPFSLIAANKEREKRSLPPIEHGKTFYNSPS